MYIYIYCINKNHFSNIIIHNIKNKKKYILKIILRQTGDKQEPGVPRFTSKLVRFTMLPKQYSTTELTK